MFLLPSLWRGLRYGTPRLIDVYPGLVSCTHVSVRSRVVRAVLMDCLTPTAVASGRRADQGRRHKVLDSPVGPRGCHSRNVAKTEAPCPLCKLPRG